MIIFDKLFDVLKKRGIGQNRFCLENDISTSVLERLRTGGSVETYTLNRLMYILDLTNLDDICTYIPDQKIETKEK